MLFKIRLYAGLVLLLFVTGHLISAALGVFSFQAMDASRAVFIAPWRSWPGTFILYGAMLTHICLALWSFYQRKTLRLKAWEIPQTVLGLLLPLVMVGHLAGTRLAIERFGMKPDYAQELAYFWIQAPSAGVMQFTLVLMVWTHGFIGFHTWARLKEWFQPWRRISLSIGVLWPALALAGFIAGGRRALEIAAADPGWLAMLSKRVNYQSGISEKTQDTSLTISSIYLAILVLILVARYVRGVIARRRHNIQLQYYGGKAMPVTEGATVLEVLRTNRIPHASVCGGRGRCSTCRVKVGKGAEGVEPPSEQETKVLERISAAPGVRLACQIKPTRDIEIAPLLPASAIAEDGFHKPGYLAGSEVEVAIAFVDLRGSTGISEGRLPYDFVFVLNQFFAAIDRALIDTGGHYAQFNGDGLMAIYGLESGVHQGALDAIRGAHAMMERIAELNERLAEELPAPLAIGVGIHTGEAIVGSMGPPAHPIISAIGDHVNVAARIEAKCKEFGVPIIVSDATVKRSGLDLSNFKRETVDVRGREGQIDIWLVDDAAKIKFETKEPVKV